MTVDEHAPPAFYIPEGDSFVPTDRSRGPWDPRSLHGRVISGLLAHEIEARHSPPGFITSRLTVDMFRLAPFAPVMIETTVVRDGNRIRVIDALLNIGGRAAARGTAVMLRTGTHPETSPYPGESAPLAGPESAPPRESSNPTERENSWDVRVAGGEFGTSEQMTAWLRPLYPMVLGRETSAFAELAGAADFAHPASNSGRGSGGLGFINADITLYLHRSPVRGWYGFRSTGHQGADGVAVGSCEVFDVAGRVGTAAVAAIANQLRA